MSDTDAGDEVDLEADPGSPGQVADDGPDDGPDDGDTLPDDLDVTAYVGPYTFPDIARRRIAGTLYLVTAAGCLLAWLLGATTALLVAAVVLTLIAAYHFVAGWHLAVDQTEALAIANRAIGMPVGHASAQLAWRGLRSRPTWRILVYSAESPPKTRGLVELDGVDGEVLGSYTEDNPEDWSEFGLGPSEPVAG